MRISRCTAIFASSVCAAALAAPAHAQERRFNIPAGNLKPALDAFARQAGRPVIYRSDDVRGAHSPGARGQLTADRALEALLAGSGFTYRVGSSGAIAIVRDASGRGSPARDTSGPVSAASDEDITVTGSRLKRAVNGFPTKSYSRAEIETSGQPNLGAYLSTLNEVSVVTPSAGVYASTNNNATVQLRGLPIGTTLTLINGRRLESFGSASGALIFDINSIPFEAIERVDIVPVGSSAIYGGDALAGVVNIVLKRSIEGLAIGANYGFGADTQDRTLSAATGHRFARGSVLLVGSMGKTTPLTTIERGFFRDADYRRFGGTDARVNTCLPGTVTRASAGNLPGLASAQAGIPDRVADTKLSTSDFAATAGVTNLCGDVGTGYGASLVNGSERYALHLGAEYQPADWLTLFGEGTYNHERIEVLFSPITLRNLLVPATNAFNPFGVDVRVTTQLGLVNGYSGRTRTTEFKRLLLGGRGQIAKGWDYEIAAMTVRDDSHSVDHSGLLSASARTAALASSDSATALNLFTTGRAASDQVLAGIWGDVTARSGAGRRDQVNAFVRGSFDGLPAGQIQIAVGGEASRDTWITAGAGFRYDTRRTAKAGFAEASLPLLARRGGGELVSLSLAGRWDSFSDFGDAKTYQAGLEIRPAEHLQIRLATATSFKPPSLLQLHPSPANYTTEDFGLRDPKRGNERIVGGVVALGPSESLAPEKGRAETLGILWNPPFLPRLRLGATGWRAKIDNLVYFLFPQTALDYESLFQALVTRGPSVGGVPGPVTRVAYQYVNFGSLRVSGLDFETSYVQPTALGDLTLAASATRTTRYDALLVPGAPTENRLSRRFADFWAPKWKGRASIGLDNGQWQLGLTGRYLGRYADSSTSEVRLGDRWAFDLAARVNLFDKAQLTATVANIGNQLPQYSPSSYGSYDVTQGDWRGRYFNLRLSTRW